MPLGRTATGWNAGAAAAASMEHSPHGARHVRGLGVPSMRASSSVVGRRRREQRVMAMVAVAGDGGASATHDGIGICSGELPSCDKSISIKTNQWPHLEEDKELEEARRPRAQRRGRRRGPRLRSGDSRRELSSCAALGSWATVTARARARARAQGQGQGQGLRFLGALSWARGQLRGRRRGQRLRPVASRGELRSWAAAARAQGSWFLRGLELRSQVDWISGLRWTTWAR